MNQNANSDPIEDDSEYFEGKEFVIRKSGYKFVDMKNIQTIKIICPPSTLLYIHNIYGIEVDLLNDDSTRFGLINEKSIDKLLISIMVAKL